MSYIKKTFISLSYLTLITLSLSQIASANQAQQNPSESIAAGISQIQTVLTGLVVAVGVCAGVWIVLKKLPGIDDPHTKNEMFKGIGYVLGGVAVGAALVWIVPWVYNIFS